MNTSPALQTTPVPRKPILSEGHPSVPEPGLIRLEDLVAALRKRVWIVASTTIAAIAAAIYLLAVTTPQYVASAQMLLGGQVRVERTSSDLFEARAFNDSVIQGELAILKSSALLIRVVRKLELDQDPEFNAALRPPSEPMPVVDAIKAFVKGILFPPNSAPETPAEPASQAVEEASAARDAVLDGLGGPIGVLRKNIDARQRGSSSVVAVTVSSTDPIKAAGIANTVADEYISFVSDKRFEAAQRFTTWLETRVAELADTVEESERAVLSFRATVDSEVDSTARLDQQMQEMTTNLVVARTALAETEARVLRARELLESEGALAAAGILSSPGLDTYSARIAELRQSETDALRRFGEDSAQVSALRREAADIESALETEVRQVVSELENSAEVLRINLGALRQNLGGIEAVILARSQEEIRLNQLERVADANRLLYSDFLGRFKESSEIQNLRTADAEVISYAAPPGAPATPRKKVVLVLATVAGLMVGIGIAFGLELLPKRFSSSNQVTHRTGLKVLGQLPKLPRNYRAGNFLRRINGTDGLALAARNMARNLDLTLGRPVSSAIVVSHASGGEKTALTMLLGWAMAKQGRSCLLIDADIQNAALSSRYEIAGVNLMDVVYDNVPCEEAIISDSVLGVSVLPTVPTKVDPATFLNTGRMEALFKLLSKRYDVIVIDAPPLESASDLVTLPGRIDIGLYAIETNRTFVSSVTDRMPLFRSMQLQFEGAILSRQRGFGRRRWI